MSESLAGLAFKLNAKHIKKKIIILVILSWVLAILLLSKTAHTIETKDIESYANQFIGPGYTTTWQEWVLGRIKEEGFSIIEADRVLRCESNYRPLAVHVNSNGTKDVGIWQINDIHGLSVEDRMDVYKSTEFAIKLLKSSGWSPWVCSRL